jgi:uncharacterized repeat protein (TIGR03803 family)
VKSMVCTVASVALVMAVFAAQPAQAQTYKVLYRFKGHSDGAFPNAVIRDANGNLYGTTFEGGIGCGASGPRPPKGSCGYGTVFKLNKTGKLTVLYSFSGGTDGAVPLGGLIRDADGNLYGTTVGGGDPFCGGCGTVFKLSRTGKETVLHSFKGGVDGRGPLAGLMQDAEGNLYGTTLYGGSGPCSVEGVSGCGTVFKVDASGKETVLYSFVGGTDGANPYGGVVQDVRGSLYGTTFFGDASNYGTVFKLSQQGHGQWKETVLHRFIGGADGEYPYAGVIQDGKGHIYGTTFDGGRGYGTVFKLGTAGKKTVIYSFPGPGPHGSRPFAGVVDDGKGNLYGTTNRRGGEGHGTVFKLGRAGKETELYNFTGGADGAHPVAGVIRDAKGNLYGTTPDGGVACPQYVDSQGCGVVFKLTP